MGIFLVENLPNEVYNVLIKIFLIENYGSKY
jgi:hypothetical protein